MASRIVFCFLLIAAISVRSNPLNSNDVIFHLYTRSNPTASEPLLATAASIMTSSFVMTDPTIITIHNFQDSVGGNFNAFVIPAALNRGSYNVLAVDWSVGSTAYTVGLSNAPLCGQYIANFINLLANSFNYDTNQIHIVGFGLGGHIAGIAARNANGNVARITALNPSFHGWTHHSQLLSSDAATLVEVLHTTAGIDGYDYPLGDYDFYPNGGRAQQGCWNDVSCSGTMSYVFFAESFQAEVVGGSKFIGTSCDSYEQAISGQCDGTNTAEFGGADEKTGPSGIYFFNTNPTQPFAQG